MPGNIDEQDIRRLSALFREKRLQIAVNMLDASRTDLSPVRVSLYISGSEALSRSERPVMQTLLRNLTGAEWEFSPITTSRGQTNDVLHAMVRNDVAMEISQRYGMPSTRFTPPQAVDPDTQAAGFQLLKDDTGERVALPDHLAVPINTTMTPLPPLRGTDRAHAVHGFETRLDEAVLPISEFAVWLYTEETRSRREGLVPAASKSAVSHPHANDKTAAMGPMPDAVPGVGDVVAGDVLSTKDLGPESGRGGTR